MLKIIGYAVLLGLSCSLAFAQTHFEIWHRKDKTPATEDIYRYIYYSVSEQNLLLQLKNMTGYNNVTVGSQTFAVSNRYDSAAKTNFRTYWTGYFNGLGIQVKELSYPTHWTNIESQGHNLEAVLPGKSSDSVVIIVHYDSMGSAGHETENPAVDDDMTGMAVSLETARVLSQYKDRLKYTVRFVAADFEEWDDDKAGIALEGARQYAQYLLKLSQSQHFKIIGAIDNEQIGWSGAASTPAGLTFDVAICSGDDKKFNYPQLGLKMEKVVKKYSHLHVNEACYSDVSDHYAMWEIGVPSLMYIEHNPWLNDHFDQNGGDILEKIDLDYFYQIARVGVTFAAKMAGL